MASSHQRLDGQDPEAITGPADHITQEIHAEREGYLALSLHPRFTRAISGGKASDADIFRHSGDLDFAFKPAAQLAAEVFTLAANGAGAMFEDLIYPEGRVEAHTYATLRTVCDQIAAREPWLGGNSVPYVAVYFSKNTRLYYGREEPGERYLLNFLGACKILLEDHIPFDIVTDRELNARDLSRFRAVMLPNAACLSDDQITGLRQPDAVRAALDRRSRKASCMTVSAMGCEKQGQGHTPNSSACLSMQSAGRPLMRLRSRSQRQCAWRQRCTNSQTTIV